MAKIGIPRTLAYFMLFPFWKTFFEGIGQEVVESSPTTREILDNGIRDTVSDACIPIKIYHGHVADLIGKVDYIFVPRLVSFRKFGDFGTETLCPKFLGLPDMIVASINNLPPLIQARIDLKQGRKKLFEVYKAVGEGLGAMPFAIRKAYYQALKVQNRYEKLLQKGILPEPAMEQAFIGGTGEALCEKKPYSLAVVGYPYAIYDSFINVGLLRMLEKAGVRVFTQDMLSWRQLNRQGKKMPKDTFWFFSNRAIQGALYFLDEKPVDGIIHVTAFACGPDSIVDRYIELEARKRSIPFMSIMIDEHTGEAGVSTRIEAFMDMLRYRRERRED